MADVFLTNLDTGEQLQIPLTPDKVSESGSAEEVSWKIISVGEVAHPRGERLTSYKWDGVLPGEVSQNAPYVQNWQPPGEIVALLRQYRREGVVLRLMVTETQINADVFISDFETTWSGGAGDAEYSITLKEYKPILVMTTDESGLENPGAQIGATIQTNNTARFFLVKITTKNSGGYSRIYKTASTGAKVLKKLKNGAEVQAVDEKSKAKFNKVKYGSVTGWMLKADLTYSRAQTTTTTTVVTEVS